ncbi:hypothetical protein SAMN04487939_11144 [Lysobacter sp. yr284]|uniref:hypothetical protein n=2 Tax=Lysobacter TaxID=68 RepID=UPI000895E19C|nr:hypothetical protein SAMN04487939_11144 [Lysobacter sp. yr284]
MPPTQSLPSAQREPRRCLVRMPLLSGFGALVCTATVVMVAIAAWQQAWTAVLILSTLFGGSGAALLLIAAPIQGDEDGLTVMRPHKRLHIAWRDILAAEGGIDALVLRTRARRESLLSYSYWHGADKNALYLLLREKLLAHGADVAPDLRAFLRMDEDLSALEPRQDRT